MVSYAWDAANNLVKLTWPDGWFAGFRYDALNRPARACANLEGTACDGQGVPLARVTYDLLSRRQSVTYANGTSAQYGYSPRGDLLCHDWNFSGAAPASCGAAGAEAAYAFTYNGARQVLSELVSDAALRWVPAAYAADSYAVNGLNQYTAVGAAAPVHDANGNLTTDHRGQTYVYDAENVLRSAAGLSGGGTAAYRYYADGTRREKTAGGTTSSFLYMGGLGYLTAEDAEFAADQEIAEYDGSTLLRRYLRLPGSIDEPFLMLDYGGPGCGSGCQTWAHQNRLGSVAATTDDAGAVVDKFTYSSYGVSGGSASGFPFRFTGQKLDPETGLYYYKARYYDPETGRFLQTDPIGYEDQMNLYAYVRNDPINGIDPTGEAAFFVTRPCCLPGQNHSFVIVTDGDSITDPIVARYSFGPEKPGGRGALTNRTGTGDATDRGDIATVDRIQSGDTDGISITQIDASDDTVIAVGDAAIGNPDYDPVPGAIGRPDGANSNSAAVAISRRSAEIDGSTFDPPDDVTLTGAEYDELVEFDEDRLPK